MKKLKRLFKIIALMLTGALMATFGFYIMFINAQPDLENWHKVELKEEYRATDSDTNLEAYLAREARLFTQLEIAALIPTAINGSNKLNRYHPLSPLHPAKFKQDWNRSFEIDTNQARGGVLLLHGLSDSPYSMHHLAKLFAQRGLYVLVLRMPGHGTIPGALTKSKWQDWSAAVRLAAVHVRSKVNQDTPFLLGGYSNGAALSVDYALDALNDPKLPRPDGLFLFSPALGVSKLAFLAKWQLNLSHLPFMAKLAWTDIIAEFDPFKYNSFPINAAYQIYRLTSSLAQKIDRAFKAEDLVQFPPITSFVSIVDSTVPIKAVINRLYDKLPQNDSEIIIFDVNRSANIEPFLKKNFDAGLRAFLARKDFKHFITLVTNRNAETHTVMAKHYPAIETKNDLPADEEALSLQWPKGVYSLSHVSIPFSPNDPLYGPRPDGKVSLGNLEPRGERGMLNVSIPSLMRLRYNPFYPYMAARINHKLDQYLLSSQHQTIDTIP